MGIKKWIKWTSSKSTEGFGARRRRLDLSLRGHEPLRGFRFECPLSRHLGQEWGEPAPSHSLQPLEAHDRGIRPQSGTGSCVWIQFPALGQVPFVADGLFTLPFVVIICDLLLIVSKINTTWQILWEQDACSMGLWEPSFPT